MTSEEISLNFENLKLKPVVQSVAPEVFKQGSLDDGQSLHFCDSRAAANSFKDCFQNFFIGSSRNKHIKGLCGILSELVAGSLTGQMNCFVGLGVKGIGKSQFFVALGDWMTRIGDRNCIFIYLEMGNRPEDSPFEKKTLNVRKIVHYFALRSWTETPEQTWETVTECMNWLIDNNKKVFLVLDEFENCFVEVNTAGLFSDLSGVGGRSGARPMVIVLLGSSSYLRNLCFCKGEEEEMLKAGFKGYNRGCNLNSTKYWPLFFDPITTVDETVTAMNSLGIDKVPDDFDMTLFCQVTRGQLRLFKRIYAQIMDGDDVTNYLVVKGDAANDVPVEILKILWGNMQHVHAEYVAKVINFEYPFTEEVQKKFSCSRQKFLDASLTLANLYNCADSSLIRFEGDNVSFLHPTDLQLCLSLFGKDPRPDGQLTMAEKISLLYADNASTDEVNEKLVCESLCDRGIVVPGIGRLRFSRNSPNCEACCTGIVRQRNNLSLLNEGHSNILGEEYLGTCKKGLVFGSSVTPAALRKEYPDELGSDLIAIYRAESFGKNVKFIVVRVQINLGRSASSVDSHGKTPIERMMEGEPHILSALNVSVDQVIFVRVLWTSRPTRDRSSSKDHIVVIRSTDMMNYWIDPVKNFMREKHITAYGYHE